MKLVLMFIGWIAIIVVLLSLPTLGSGLPGFKGFAVGLFGWALWWAIVHWIYRSKPRQNNSSN